MSQSGGSTAEGHIKGVLSNDLRSLSKTMTLVESSRPADRKLAEAVLTGLLPHAGKSIRVGISGPPGVGKSTLIEVLGTRLHAAGKQLAVLAVDPSSALRGGSILGDKSRMGKLCELPDVMVRPSPSGGSVGGVASRTRETILLCEAAGHDVVLVESIGVGQAEYAVAGMVDFFLLLVSPDGGDELQSIKRGILELADAVAVTKADSGTSGPAARLRESYRSALRLLHPAVPGWDPPALAISAHQDIGIEALWETVERHHALLRDSGGLDKRRTAQATTWMWRLVEEDLRVRSRSHPEVQQLEQQVAAQALTPIAAAQRVMKLLMNDDS